MAHFVKLLLVVVLCSLISGQSIDGSSVCPPDAYYDGVVDSCQSCESICVQKVVFCKVNCKELYETKFGSKPAAIARTSTTTSTSSTFKQFAPVASAASASKSAPLPYTTLPTPPFPFTSLSPLLAEQSKFHPSESHISQGLFTNPMLWLAVVCVVVAIAAIAAGVVIAVCFLKFTTRRQYCNVESPPLMRENSTSTCNDDSETSGVAIMDEKKAPLITGGNAGQLEQKIHLPDSNHESVDGSNRFHSMI